MSMATVIRRWSVCSPRGSPSTAPSLLLQMLTHLSSQRAWAPAWPNGSVVDSRHFADDPAPRIAHKVTIVGAFVRWQVTDCREQFAGVWCRFVQSVVLIFQVLQSCLDVPSVTQVPHLGTHEKKLALVTLDDEVGHKIRQHRFQLVRVWGDPPLAVAPLGHIENSSAEGSVDQFALQAAARDPWRQKRWPQGC